MLFYKNKHLLIKFLGMDSIPSIVDGSAIDVRELVRPLADNVSYLVGSFLGGLELSRCRGVRYCYFPENEVVNGK